jgi:hypothetical protein
MGDDIGVGRVRLPTSVGKCEAWPAAEVPLSSAVGRFSTHDPL